MKKTNRTDGTGVKVDWSAFEVVDTDPEPHYHMKPCLRFLFYLQAANSVIKKGLQKFSKLTFPLIQDESKFHFKPFKARYGSGGIKHAKNNKNTFRLLDDYVKAKAKDADAEFEIELETTSSPYGISDKSIDIYHASYRKFGFASLSLPVDHFAEDFEACAKFADSLASCLPVRFGYVGYAVNIAFESQNIRCWEDTEVYHLSRKYLGVDFRKPYEFVNFEDPDKEHKLPGEGLTNVAWITYLNPDSFDKVKLSAKARKSVRAVKTAFGVQAAPAPSVLPIRNEELLQPYRAIAKKLKPLGLQKDMIRRCGQIGDNPNTRWWVERFWTSQKPPRRSEQS